MEVALVRREVLGLRPVRKPVAHAYGQLVERGQHVELRERERRDAVHANREAERDEIEPPAPPLTACDGPELVTQRLDAFVVRADDLAREGPSPTRVTYALATPSTSSMRFGPIPKLTAAPAAIGLDEVTNGYVP